MRRLTFVFLNFSIAALLLSTHAWAQATAQISGTVKDPSGAVLPGVEITATQTETGIVRTTVTNETGSYVLSNLALGPYRLEAALTGFRAFVQTGIVLQVNGSPVINPVLEVGQVSEQVEVQANATLAEEGIPKSSKQTQKSNPASAMEAGSDREKRASNGWLTLHQAAANNLKDITTDIPLVWKDRYVRSR